MATHDSNIAVTLAFGAPAVTEVGFGTAALLDSGSALGGGRIATYTNSAQAQADAGLSVFAKAAAQAVFSQAPAPAEFKVISVKGIETYSDALALAITLDPDFYVVLLNSRVPAIIAALIPTIEASERVLWFQDDDGAWLTGTPPAAYAALLTSERAFLLYHQTDASPAAEAAVTARYTFNADVRTQGFEGNVAGAITPNDSGALTAAQKNFLINTNKGNILLPFGPRVNYLSPGQNLAGRPASEILAGDWLRARTREDLIRLKLGYDARGEMIPVTVVGQALVKGVIAARVEQGVVIGKFKPGQVVITQPAITPADVTARRIRTTVFVTTNTPAGKFDVDLNVGSADVTT